MMRAWALLGLVCMAVSCGGVAPEPAEMPEPSTEAGAEMTESSAGTIERLDPAFDELVSQDAVIEQLADGFIYTESPLWVNEMGGFLLFSDVIGNRMIKWTPADGASDFIAPVYEEDYEQGSFVGPNGIVVDSEGQIVFVEHYNHRISRISPDGTGRSVVVDSYEGTRFNSPNDLIYRSDGSLYFTDPPYGLPPGTQGQDVNGVYRLDPDGTVTREVVLEGANGLAFSPDESRLYATGVSRWIVNDVAPDGSLGEGELFLEGGGDGLKLTSMETSGPLELECRSSVQTGCASARSGWTSARPM